MANTTTLPDTLAQATEAAQRAMRAHWLTDGHNSTVHIVRCAAVRGERREVFIITPNGWQRQRDGALLTPDQAEEYATRLVWSTPLAWRDGGRSVPIVLGTTDVVWISHRV